MLSLVEENYLKAMFHLSKNGVETVSVNALSKYLNIKMPTVNSMMKKLADKELVFYKTYKPLKLTEKGILKATSIVRKHRLTEMFLVEKMGLGWENVHPIAEQIEHIQSDVFFDKMDEMLNYPTTDPHGSPIPDKNGKIFEQGLKKLSDYKVDDELTICAVTNTSKDFLSFLTEKDILLNDKIRIIEIQAYDKSMKVLLLKNNEVTFLSTLVTNNLCVK